MKSLKLISLNNPLTLLLIGVQDDTYMFPVHTPGPATSGMGHTTLAVHMPGPTASGMEHGHFPVSGNILSVTLGTFDQQTVFGLEQPVAEKICQPPLYDIFHVSSLRFVDMLAPPSWQPFWQSSWQPSIHNTHLFH